MKNTINSIEDVKVGGCLTFRTPDYNNNKTTTGVVLRVVGESVLLSCMNRRSRVCLRFADLSDTSTYN